jgi:hypothetical protein
MLGSILNRRYRLEQRLGASAAGQEFLATDTGSGEMLAVRLLPGHARLSGESGLRYRRALARLKGIQHPHLLIPAEAASANGRAFLAAPYYPSVPLAQALKEQPLTIPEAVRVLHQLAQALEVLHAAGVVHGGVNPDNILLSREDGPQAVLAYPALNLLLAPEDAALPAVLFKAPEECPALEAGVDGRSDLYALGMIAFLLLTGRLPFEAATAAEAWRHHLGTPAPDPRTLRAEVPPPLAAIVAKLLAKPPARRYQTAAGVKADLAQWGQEPARPLAHQDFPPPFAPGVPPLGRETARQALLAGLGRAAAGQGGIVVLAAPPGMGKGGLFRATQPELLAAGALLLRARPPAIHPPEPHALFRAWCGDLLAQWELLPDARRRDLLYRLHQAVGVHAGLLGAIVPALEPLLPQSGAWASSFEEGGYPVAAHGAAEALLALAHPAHPLLLWIEDLARLDGDALELLRFLGDRLPESGLVLAGGFPLEGNAGTPPVLEWLHSPSIRRHVAWVELPLLAPEHIQASAAAWLGIRWPDAPPADAEVAASAAAWLERHWGGVPLAIELGLRVLVSKRVLALDKPHRSHGAAWRLDGAALEAVRPPESLAALIQAWLDTLSEGLVLTLEAAAAAAGPVTLESLAALLEGFPEEALVEHLEAAVQQGVLYRAWDGLRFREARVRRAIQEATLPARQRLFHQALAGGLEAQEDPAPPLRHALAAWHFGRADDPERAAPHILALLHSALALGAAQAAMAAFQALPDALLRQIAHEDCLALIAAAGAAGQVQAAEGLAAGATHAEQADLLLARAELAAGRGELEPALSMAEQALERVGERLAHHPVGAAWARWAGDAARRYEGLLSLAAGGAPMPLAPEEERRCRVLERYARIAGRANPERALQACERIVRIAGPRQASGLLIRALIRLGRAEGHPESPSLREAGALLQRHDFPREAVALGIAEGYGALAQFELTRARQSFEGAWQGARTLGHLPLAMEAALGLFELARLQGPAEALTRGAARLARLCALMPGRGAAATADAAAALAAAAQGGRRPEAALPALIAAGEYFAAQAWPAQAGGWLAAALELAAAAGLTEAARRCIPLAEQLSAHSEGALTAALAEWHLAQAAMFPGQSHLVHAARAALKALHAAARYSKALAMAWEGLSALEWMARGRAEEGLARLEALASPLEAQGARLLWARLCLQAASTLKSAGHEHWLAWAGKALVAFDAAGTSGFAQAVRLRLGLDPPSAVAEPDASVTVTAHSPLHGGLTAWFDRMAREGALEPRELHGAVVRLFREQAEAERAALYVPDADGQLVLAAQAPCDALAAEPFNRWMVESARREARGLVADHYPSGEQRPEASGMEEALSVLYLPLVAAGRVHAVTALGSTRGHRVYDNADAARLSQLGHQAGLLLALNDSLSGHTAQRRSADARQARACEILEWSLRTGAASAQELLADYHSSIAEPLGFESAVLFRLEPGPPRRLVPAAVSTSGLPPPMPAHLEVGDQARAALEGLAAIPLSSGQGPRPSTEEQRLFNQWQARDAVWLPVVVRGDPVGLVLLLAGEPRSLPAQRVESELSAPLRAVAGALAALLALDGARRELRDLAGRHAELKATEEHMKRYLPPPLDGTRPFPAKPGAAIEVELAAVAGHVPWLRRLARLGASAWARAQETYWERVGHGLGLHQGHLHRIADAAWLAYFPGGAQSALWGAQSLHGLLEAFAEDQVAASSVPLRTGLGVHTGPALAGTVAVGDHLEALLEGDAARGARELALMAGHLRCPVLVSGDAIADGLPQGIALRALGTLRIAPGERRIEVFELYSARPAPIVAAMRELEEPWDTAIRHYRLGEWERAWPLFLQYAARLPEDRPARYFLRRCKMRRR